ncbi:hypothetical protein [Emticicia aquatilis]|uniref:hypothetical protein n=1 Tax=Emticicia aquatilis TaxID=1537369 RepID=UPI00166E9330|nr:hypothetical protein [Emticicia aquatilis]
MELGISLGQDIWSVFFSSKALQISLRHLIRADSMIFTILACSFVGGHQIGAVRKVGLSPTRANK